MKQILWFVAVLLLPIAAGAQQTVDVAIGSDLETTEINGLAPEAGYGYTERFPILVGGIENGDFESRLSAYFNLLRAANGDRLIFILAKTCCGFETPSNPNGGFLQVYEVGIEGGKPVDLYVNGYDRGTLYMPHGMLAGRSAELVETVEDALELVELGDPTAISKLEVLADTGDMMAQYHLARVFADRRDFEAAYPWFLKAAESGHNISQATISTMLNEGQGVAPNPALAQQWLRRAATNGHAGSRMMVALKLLGGPADRRRLEEGAVLLHMAAQQGDPAAQAAYGLMLYYGRGVRRDTYQGLMWLYLADRAGDKNANSLFPKLAAEQRQTMLARVKLAAEDWLARPGPPPVVPDEQIPDFY